MEEAAWTLDLPKSKINDVRAAEYIKKMKNPIKSFRKFKSNVDSSFEAQSWSTAAISELLEIQLLSTKKYDDKKSLIPHRQKVFSQFGQDGIIREIFRRVGIKTKRFVEIGTSPLENNTNMLLLGGWSGLWIDLGLPQDLGLPLNLSALQKSGRLKILREIVDRENCNRLLANAKYDCNLDFVSIDIDLNTFHIFERIVEFAPRVLAIEYNGSLPADVEWIAPYSDGCMWNGSNLFGASLLSITKMAGSAGYSLVGCELSGTDAFFVRDEDVGCNFLEPNNVEFHWEPLRMHLDRRRGHRVDFLPESHVWDRL